MADLQSLITIGTAVSALIGVAVGYVASPKGKAAVKAMQDLAMDITDYMKGKQAGGYTDADYIEIGKRTVALFDDLAAAGGMQFKAWPPHMPAQQRQGMKMRVTMYRR